MATEHEITPATSTALAANTPSSVGVTELLRAFLGSKSPSTLAAYTQDLSDFRAFLKFRSTEQAVELLLRQSPGKANLTVLRFRAHLVRRKFSPSAVNRKLSALRSLVEFGGVRGVVNWQLHVPNVKNHRFDETRTPGVHQSLLAAAAAAQSPAKAARDRALVQLVFGAFLSRTEAVSLTAPDFDSASGVLHVPSRTGQGALVSLPPTVAGDVRAWLQVRGATPGPMFPSFARSGGALSASGVRHVLAALASKCKSAAGESACENGAERLAEVTAREPLVTPVQAQIA